MRQTTRSRYIAAGQRTSVDRHCSGMTPPVEDIGCLQVTGCSGAPDADLRDVDGRREV
ncbi:hypothetical protein J6590_019203 [Homalodisca vitripennis]|nr:hypothetical protein J6590_019203 [Homalodisca vitripennis]